MSALRESLGLPLLFLTVAWAGGFRLPAAGMHFVPPPLMSLFLAVLLLGVMARSGLLLLPRLMGPQRSGLENTSGAVVLATLFAATTQVFNALTPPAGLLRLFFHLFFIFLLWTTLAAQPDRQRLLRTLMVVLGGALVIQHILFAALFDPTAGTAHRLAVAVLEGVTLGTLGASAPVPAEGYVAFFMLALYMIGLVLLPRSNVRSVVVVESDKITAP